VVWRLGAKDLEPWQIKQKGHYNRPKAVWRWNGLPKTKETPPKPCYTQDPTKFGPPAGDPLQCSYKCNTMTAMEFGEDRWKTVGLVEPALLAVVYTLRGKDGNLIRLISARKADAHERAQYREVQT
jgi:hypothetical protein